MVGTFVGGAILSFLLVTAASYVGAKMALRSFFGREYVDPETGEFVIPASEIQPEDTDD